MMNKLSSLNLTLWALGAISFCLLVGVVLAQVPPSSRYVALMNKGLVLDWFLSAFSEGLGPLLIAIWFVALCASVGLLVINLCACTYTRLWPRFMRGKRLHNTLLFLVHALMIVILTGHLSQMTMGFKDESVRLQPGQSVELPNGTRLVLDNLTYADDKALLNLTYRQARRVQTTTAFNRDLNSARISLWQDGMKIDSGMIRTLEPLKAAGMRLTLSDFYLEESSESVGVVLAVSGNPFTELFFLAYISWIVVYVLLSAMGCQGGEKLSLTHNEAIS